jgi:hypothetical protein
MSATAGSLLYLLIVLIIVIVIIVVLLKFLGYILGVAPIMNIDSEGGIMMMNHIRLLPS